MIYCYRFFLMNQRGSIFGMTPFGHVWLSSVKEYLHKIIMIIYAQILIHYSLGFVIILK